MSEPRQFIGWEEMLRQELVDTAVIDLADECSHSGVIARGRMNIQNDMIELPVTVRYSGLQQS